MKQSELVARLATALLASSEPTPREIDAAVCCAYDILHAARLEGARRHKESEARAAAVRVAVRDDEAPVNDR